MAFQSSQSSTSNNGPLRALTKHVNLPGSRWTQFISVICQTMDQQLSVDKTLRQQPDRLTNFEDAVKRRFPDVLGGKTAHSVKSMELLSVYVASRHSNQRAASRRGSQGSQGTGDSPETAVRRRAKKSNKLSGPALPPSADQKVDKKVDTKVLATGNASSSKNVGPPAGQSNPHPALEKWMAERHPEVLPWVPVLRKHGYTTDRGSKYKLVHYDAIREAVRLQAITPIPTTMQVIDSLSAVDDFLKENS